MAAMRTNNRHFIGAGLIVHGNGNTVSGAGNIVHGDNNTVTGAGAVVRGNGNTVTGAGHKVYGNNNTVRGAGCTAEGTGNTVNSGEPGNVTRTLAGVVTSGVVMNINSAVPGSFSNATCTGTSMHTRESPRTKQSNGNVKKIPRSLRARFRRLGPNALQITGSASGMNITMIDGSVSIDGIMIPGLVIQECSMASSGSHTILSNISTVHLDTFFGADAPSDASAASAASAGVEHVCQTPDCNDENRCGTCTTKTRGGSDTDET